ncbi:MAG: hypothetical protein WDN31_11500 [Hyphomicrobium sp.]
MIAPLSLVATSRTRTIRELVCARTHWISSYDMRPGSLFEGVAQRLAILVSQNSGKPPARAYVGGYRRWSSEERAHLIEVTCYADAPQLSPRGAIPKLESEIERAILMKVVGDPLERRKDQNSEPIVVHRIVRYFIKALDFVPSFVGSDGAVGRSADYKEFHFSREQRVAITALLNSTLFYWFWRLHSDGFHCGYADVYAVPFPPVERTETIILLSDLTDKLMDHLRDHSEIKSITTKAGRIQYQEFRMAGAKSLLDEIDTALAEHYGLSPGRAGFRYQL